MAVRGPTRCRDREPRARGTRVSGWAKVPERARPVVGYADGSVGAAGRPAGRIHLLAIRRPSGVHQVVRNRGIRAVVALPDLVLEAEEPPEEGLWKRTNIA